MADEMTLQLEVQDNAAQAAQSLERLAGALESVRNTVRDGLKLTDFSKNLSQLSESVMSAIPESSLLKLERLSTALTSLKEAGSVRLDVDPRSTLFRTCPFRNRRTSSRRPTVSPRFLPACVRKAQAKVWMHLPAHWQRSAMRQTVP